MRYRYLAHWRGQAVGLFVGASLVLPALAAVPDPAYDAFQLGNYLTALKEAEIAAASGDPAAHTLIGVLYSKGLGVAKDLPAAARWYEQGAKLAVRQHQP